MKKLFSSILALGLLLGGNAYAECIKGDCTNGNGTFNYKNGKKYIGEWENGKREGQGVLFGDKVDGKFLDKNQKNVVVSTINGDIKISLEQEKYSGNWKNDNKHGFGTGISYQGEVYIGEWKNGKYDGQGTLLAYGDTYTGNFKNDYKSGKGTTIYSNGIKHVGVWDNGSETSEGTFTFTDGTTFVGWGRDYIEKQSEKLSNKDSSLNAKEILELCKEYRVNDISGGNYDNAAYGMYRGNTDFCRTTIMISEFKIDAKNNLVKELDIGKIKFNLLSNEYFSVSLPEGEITKSSTCHMDIKKERSLTYLQIYKRCGVEIKDEDTEAGRWISITDYFYADANNDDYMDLIIRFKDDGSFSMRPMTMTAVITSLSKGKFINTNYETK